MNRFALLSLYRSLTRHKLHAALDIGGLAVGIAVFLVLGLYVRFETGFETWLPDHDRIYRVQTELHLPGGTFNGTYPQTMAGMLEQMRADFPDLAGTRIRGGKDGGSVIRGDQATREDVAQVDPSFFDIFALPMVRGNGARALADPSAVLLSRSAAHKFFGESDPMGQTMRIAVDAPATYRVAGIFEDLPANTALRFSILMQIPRTAPPAQWMWYKWGTASLETYVKFRTPADARAFQQRLPAFIKRRAGQDLGPDPTAVISLPLLPITAGHLQPTGPESAGRKLTVVTMGVVGALTLLIAIVNHVSLATAQASLRAREVAMRKVLGADRAALLRQFLGEAIVIVAVAALVALILAEIGLPFVNAAGGLSLTIPYAVVVPTLLCLVLVVGVVAGWYPALLLSRYPGVAMLGRGGGRGGSHLREALVVLQFGLAIAFVIGTVVLTAQMAHSRKTDLGFRRDGLMVVPSLLDQGIWAERARSILAAMRDIPGVASVGVGSIGPGGDGTANVDAVEVPGRPQPGVSILAVTTGKGFFDTYAPRLLAGRLFDDAHRADDSSDWRTWPQGRNIVINRKAAAALGFRTPQEAIGRTVGGGLPRTIIGVIDQLRFFSPRTPEGAVYYVYNRDMPPSPVAVIRFSGDRKAMLEAVRAAWRRIAPDVPFSAAMVGQRLESFYQADEQATRLFAIGAGLAVLIGCVGLWGLASFNTARRIKEIGIRKTLGASSGDIVALLVGQFLRPVLLANLIAWPLAFVAMRTWLAGFDDRITLSPLYFIGASLLAIAVAVLTVLGQSLRASRAAPAWALRHD
ncbi:ABC transporter permease [Sphingomonas carotinifaciens]|uniref:ABC transporter permease n=1 Tax=Sphingomonas carotinifaciens TaxID=1166323 RepID=UPI000DDBF581|nr:ABC transporter permease [Sphingomonas carotinifaciens]